MDIAAIMGDLTKIEVDAIVNAANSSLMGGGGVDGAIHRAGGPSILEECRKIIARHGSCKTGEAVVTGAGRLPSRFVIHTVGPVWNGGNNNETENLSKCYYNALSIAIKNDCRSIAFPNISTGIYRFPKALAASIAVRTVTEYLDKEAQVITVRFVCFDAENFELVSAELNKRGIK